MKKTGCKALFIVFFFLLRQPGFTQIDSLVFYCERGTAPDLEKAEYLMMNYSIHDSALFETVAGKLHGKEMKLKFYHTLGDRFFETDDYESARIYYTKSLKLARLTLDKAAIANELSSLGDMYRMKEQNTVALNMLTQAMYLYKELKDTNEAAYMLGLIGDINRCLQQYQDALKYLNESLSLIKSGQSSKNETFAYSSMGATYQSMKEYDKAMDYFMKGLDLAAQRNDSLRLIDFYYSIGDVMTDRGKVPEAINYLEKALSLTPPNDKYNIAFCHMGLSRAYLKKHDYDNAIKAGLVTYRIGEELNAYGFCTESSETLYEAYAGKNDYKNAYHYLKRVKDNTDSTMSSERIKQEAQTEINFQRSFQEKQDSIIRFTEQKQRDQAHEAELKQERTVAIFGIAGLAVSVLVASLMYRSYRKEKRSRKIINEQKGLVDAKNKEIVDSINYAKKIQQAIIPTNAEVKNLLPSSFVILQPKDIVSGDFYWITEKENFLFLAVADCTGHGVPGGFMSMLGTALLNEIISDKNVYEPADILDILKLKIILALRQSENINENKDGMDITLIRFDKIKSKVVFAGANNSLYHVRGNVLNEYKGDKHPIGYSFNNTNKQFNQVSISLQKDDVLYMFTDGYPDQFGGPLGKKFKYKALEQTLLQISKDDMNAQRKKLLRLHDQWKGTLEQVDDICVVGVRV